MGNVGLQHFRVPLRTHKECMSGEPSAGWEAGGIEAKISASVGGELLQETQTSLHLQGWPVPGLSQFLQLWRKAASRKSRRNKEKTGGAWSVSQVITVGNVP